MEGSDIEPSLPMAPSGVIGVTTRGPIPPTRGPSGPMMIGLIFTPVVLMVALLGLGRWTQLSMPMLWLGLAISLHGAYERHWPSIALAWIANAWALSCAAGPLYREVLRAITPITEDLSSEHAAVYAMAAAYFLSTLWGRLARAPATPADSIGDT